MTTLFNYLLVFNVFGGGFIFILPSLPFEFYVGYIFVILFLMMYIICYRDISINSSFLVILMIMTITSFVNIYFGNNTFSGLIKQALGIFMTGTVYYLLIKVNDFKVDRLFKIYMQFAIIAAVIGLFQEFSFLVGFKNGYDYSFIVKKWWLTKTSFGMIRVNSIFMEPSHFATTMAPALFVSLDAILRNNSCYAGKWVGMLIITSIILTFSMVAYITILLSLLLIIFSDTKRFRYLLLVAMTIPIIAYASYRYVPDIRMRVDHTIGIARGELKVANSNLSTYSLGSNAFIAYKSFKNSPLFGSGLGSHPISYDKFFPIGISKGFCNDAYPLVNRADASALFIRLVSETGLFGIAVVFYFIFRFHINNNGNKSLHIMSNAIFVLFIAQLIRQGHYFYNGLFFFVWIYYFAYKAYEKGATI